MGHINDLVQGCSDSIANALELLQFRTKPSIYDSNEYEELITSSVRF